MVLKKTYQLDLVKCFFIFLFVCSYFSFAQESLGKDYYSIRQKFESLGFDDPKAIPYIKEYIAKAKRENNLAELASGYGYFSTYSKDPSIKMIYADSAVIFAKKGGDNQEIGYQLMGKGIIYYSNFRQYQHALQQYLEAYKYLQNPTDAFGEHQKYKNLYHVAVTQSYLGNYGEAISKLKECINFYKPATFSKEHPNNIYNFKKGYINSLVQLASCYQSVGNFDEAERLLKEDFENLPVKEFENETAYLLQIRGINNFYNDKLQNAVKDFADAKKRLKSENDFGRLEINNLYEAKTYDKLGDKSKAVALFKQNDSIFIKHRFLFPQAREGYEYLINYYKNNGDKASQLFYTTQLLEVDSILEKDFKSLSAKIHKEYDTAQLVSEKNRLQSNNSVLQYLVYALGILSLLFLGLLLVLRNRSKKIKIKYAELEAEYLQTKQKLETENSTITEKPKISVADKDWQVLALLQDFEKGNKFTQKGLTVSQLAEELNIGPSELSRIINEHKGVNFSKYLSGLRIAYITKLLFEDRKYLEYKIEALALECGISSRQNFSDLFTEINGMRPKDFIALRRKELGISG